MRGTVTITVLTGPHRNQQFHFQDPVCCNVGRGADCLVCLAGSERDLSISRHHCRLDIDLPHLRLRDLGSLNGTFLNGRRLEPGTREVASAVAVQNGDVVTIGGTSFRIDLTGCPHLAEVESGDGQAQCAAIRQDCLMPC